MTQLEFPQTSKADGPNPFLPSSAGGLLGPLAFLGSREVDEAALPGGVDVVGRFDGAVGRLHLVGAFSDMPDRIFSVHRLNSLRLSKKASLRHFCANGWQWWRLRARVRRLTETKVPGSISAYFSLHTCF